MKTVIGISQFFKSNTPKVMQVIGDISMILGFVGGLPQMISLMAGEAGVVIVIPAIILKASKIAIAFGFGIKMFTKFLGQKEVANEKPI